MPSHELLAKGRMLVLFAFCLLNPFAGWAYLAERRDAESMHPPSISDTVKPKRLAVLPVTGGVPGTEEWAEILEVELLEQEQVLVVPIERTAESLDSERDVLALGRGVQADLVLDARASLYATELHVYARVIRIADETVRWSELFVGTIDDLLDIQERVRAAILRFL